MTRAPQRLQQTATHVAATRGSRQQQRASMLLFQTPSKLKQQTGRINVGHQLAATQQTTVGSRSWCLILLCCWLFACNHGDKAATTMVAATAADLLTIESHATTSNQKQQQQTSGCDLLFTTSDNLANYCHCKDVELMPDFGGGGAGIELPKQNNDNSRLPTAAQINQLSCLPHNFSQFLQDLFALHQSASSLSSITFQVDYLDIRTNFTQSSNTERLRSNAAANIDQKRRTKKEPEPATPAADDRKQWCLIIDHISLQLTTTESETAPTTNEKRSSQRSSAAASSMAAVAALEEQMIDFVGLINETHLQFLSIFLEDNKSDGTFGIGRSVPFSSLLPRAGSGVGDDDDADSNNNPADISVSHHSDDQAGELAATAAEEEVQIKFSRLLVKLSGLSRLELSLNSRAFNSLLLEQEIFKSQTKLKWLNLASNRQVKFGQDVIGAVSNGKLGNNNKSPFAYSGLNLEYLSLESCSLDRFPLFSLFSIPFKINGKTHFGLPNLTSLNLAGNKLASFERDLFAHFYNQHQIEKSSMAQIMSSNHEASTSTTNLFETACGSSGRVNKHDKNAKIFLLLALTQLDLSNNKLSDLNFKVGQYLLCTMPNLNQLYLQRNRIVHLNLNSLLGHPFLAPDPISINEAVASRHQIADEAYEKRTDPAVKFSRLEYIDLSHNKLRRITAFQQRQNSMAASTPTFSNGYQAPRVKSINLGHNNLRSAPFVTLLDSQLINTVLFKESFDFYKPLIGANNSSNEQLLPTNSLDDLEELFQLSLAESNNASLMTICDFLSPARKLNEAAANDDEDDNLVNEVILTNNRFNRLTGKEFSSQQCKNIQILSLSNNRITNIEEETLFTLRQLEQLDLSQNFLTTFSSETNFIKNVRLRVLNLSKNRINLLNRNIFSHLLELEELLLNENELFALPIELFSQNNRLNYIDLSKNKLTLLEYSLFSNLKQLRVLNLNENQLKRFSHLLFQWSSTSNTMNMNVSTTFQNQNRLDLQSQSNHYNDRQLSQTSNKSTMTSGKRFNNLKSPAQKSQFNNNKRLNRQSRRIADNSNNNNEIASNVLVLASNQIDSINLEECVQFVKNIQLIWLNDNQLKELTPASFKCLPFVQRLYLQSNRIRSIHESSFSLMKRLEYIDLSENQLGRIQPATFASSELLRHVDLSSNNLIQLDLMESFTRKPFSEDRLVQIENLNLRNNPKLKLISADLIAFLSSHSSTIRQLNLGSIWQIKQSSQTVKSSNSLNVNSRVHLESLNLSSIQSIDDQLFITLNESLAVSIERLDLSFTLANLDVVERPSFGKKLNSFLACRMENDLIKLNLGNNQLGNEPIVQLLSDRGEQNQLVDLNLTSNRIELWPFDHKTAHRLSKLRSLDLSQNKMRYFIKKTAEIGGYLFTQLESLILNSNALISLLEYQAHHQMKKLSALMPKLKTIDLSYNRLTWIPAQFFADLNELTLLKLNHNQLETMPTVIATNYRLILDLSFNFKLRVSNDEIAVKQHQHGITRDFGTEFDDYELVFYESQAGLDHHTHVACQHINEYISSQQRPSSNNELESDDTYKFDLTQIRGIGSQDEDRISSSGGERCYGFINIIDSIKINSVSSSVNLGTIDGFETNKFVHMSLDNNGLIKLETTISADKSNSSRMITDHIIILNLSQNKIQNLTKSLCQDLTELRSLDLSNNQLRYYPFEALEKCSKLAYLDLSLNKISSLIDDKILKNSIMRNLRWTNSLLVLKLNQNALTDLNSLSAQDLGSLRFLDLRYNLLKFGTILPILSSSHSTACTIANDFHLKDTETADLNQKPILNFDNKSLSIIWPRNENQDYRKSKNYYSQMINFDNKNLAFQYNDDGLSIKFCTFDQKSLTQLCFKMQSDSKSNISREHRLIPNRCFYVKSPKSIPSCLTKLLEPTKSPISFGHNSTTDDHPVQLISQKDRTTSGNLDRANANQDPVLSFIDALKVNWLKLKRVDVNEYLSSITNTKGDTIWISEQYQIQTLTFLKIVIVAGSICIVALLVTVFRSLIRHKEHQSPKSTSELTNLTNTDTEVSHNSSLTNCKSLSCSGSDSSALQDSKKSNSETTQATNATCSSINSRSNSSIREDTTTNQQTVIERKIMIHVHDQLDANQLMLQQQQQQQQQQPQACSTPSSSLAPSSVETAETMQAVDSIQSGFSNVIHFGGGLNSMSSSGVLANIGSVDQYTENHGGNLCDNIAQQRPQKVATVMRMVKSSSANFDYNNSQQQHMSQANNHHHHLNVHGQTYGTLNPRYSNYLTLKSKLRAIQERQQHEQQDLCFTRQQQPHEPIPLEGFYNPNEQQLLYNTYQQAQYGDLDGFTPQQPRTVDHTSNQMIVACDKNSANFLDQQPTTMSSLSINTTLSGATCNNLRSLAETSQQVSPASTTTPGGGDLLVTLPAPALSQQQQNLCHYHRRGQNGESIVAGAILEQEEEQYQQQGNDLMLMSNLPPPPPSSRAIEALENPNIIRHMPCN